MTTVTIINKGTQKLTLLLQHEDVCTQSGKCFCTNGKPLAIHLPVGIPQKNIPAAVIFCPNIKNNGLIILPTPQRVEPGQGRSHRKGKKRKKTTDEKTSKRR